MRKNSLGIQGAVCIAALLIRNKTLENLALNDNDFGPDGGECIGVALSQNHSLRVLKIAENNLGSEGAIPIINSAADLKILNLAKNHLKADCGKPLKKLLRKTKRLTKLQLEYNELMVQGARYIASGLIKNSHL
jgi:Ran GTPase-activating protein (RanGAP) involved in mRNA processing and transport